MRSLTHTELTRRVRRLYTLVVRPFLVCLAAAAAWAQSNPAAQAVVQDSTHLSQVLEGERAYRVYLPPSYAQSRTRYPVIYWFHGFEQASDVAFYTSEIASYVSTHDVIVVNSGPVETSGMFPLYFPELINRVDSTLRTIPDRDHRAVTGYLAGGFFALLVAGKFPDLVSSASSFLGPTDYTVGPHGFDVDYNLDDYFANYDGVRTRLITETGQFLSYYHKRLTGVWGYARDGHETENFDTRDCTPGLAKTFDFHMQQFAQPSPKPAVFSHADVYPNFIVWDWQVASARRQPGVTILQDVSPTGFRSAVREWMPAGATLPQVKLSIASAPVYKPGSSHMVTYLRLRDGYARRSPLRADGEGRLNFDLDGDAYQVGISADPLIAVTGYEITDASWATAGEPVKLKVKFANVGAGPSRPLDVHWEAADTSVKFDTPAGHLGALGPGESAALPVSIDAPDPRRTWLRFVAVAGASRLPIRVPMYPHSDPIKVFQIADGTTVDVMHHAVSENTVTFGEGNRDGHAAPGEEFAVLVPDGEFLRAAELFTNDPCVDNTVRGTDTWTDFDHSGASVVYSLPRIRKECEPGYVIHMLGRIMLPRTPEPQPWYVSIEIPIWYRSK